jgi:hypothetical protein
MKKQANGDRNNHELYQPPHRIRHHKNPVQLHKCRIRQDQWQGADDPNGNGQLERTDKMKA